MLYPLKFAPILLDKIWGSEHLKQMFSPASDALPNVGEAWVLTAYDKYISPIINGHLAGDSLQDILEVYMNELVGDKVYETFGNTFPLLVKLIAADDDLSVQVHPDDEYAAAKDDSFGKTEMWYVLRGNDTGETILAGWNEPMTRDKVRQAVVDGAVMQYVRSYCVQEGDSLLIKPGTVHALKKGSFVAEIQQNSDMTYRLFDYNRTDSAGNKRPLHLEKALDVLNYNVSPSLVKLREDGVVSNLVQTPYFTVNKLVLDKIVQRDYAPLDSFVIYLCVKGQTTIETTEIPVDAGAKVQLSCGECCLIPAVLNDVTIMPEGNTELLEIYIE
ncbi:MAG: class I mannose-6-phosphate isomerase [Paludibacteraceae bacterium]|nr:class I mannose-6-phosphate isomerase [Paludibacteraceae bacterium]